MVDTDSELKMDSRVRGNDEINLAVKKLNAQLFQIT